VILLHGFETQTVAEIWKLRLHFRTAARADDDALEALNKAIDSIAPWLTGQDPDDLGGDTDTIMGMIADWYRVFGDDPSVNLGPPTGSARGS